MSSRDIRNAEPKQAVPNNETKGNARWSTFEFTDTVHTQARGRRHAIVCGPSTTSGQDKRRRHARASRMPCPTSRHIHLTPKTKEHPSNRQLSIPPPQPRPIDRHADIRPHDGHVARERGDGAEEVAEEDGDAVQLHAEADQRPAEEDEDEAGEEGGGTPGLLLAGEEEEGLLGPDYYC